MTTKNKYEIEQALLGITPAKPETILFHGEQVPIKSLSKSQLLQAMEEKACREGRTTYTAAVRACGLKDLEALAKGPKASSRKRANRAGSPADRAEFVKAAKEKWEQEGRAHEPRSTKSEMVAHLRASNPNIGASDLTAESWLKGLGLRSYKRGKAQAK